MVRRVERLNGRDREDTDHKKSNPVWETRVIGEDETESANIREHIVRMKDGSYYKMNTIMPKKRNIGMAMLRTAAFTTAHDQGFEREYALRAAEIGVPVFSFTPQQNLNRIGRMSRSSHDYVESGKYFSRVLGLDDEHMLTGGSSRGADHSIGMASVAPKHDVEVDYFDAEAPCMGGALDLRQLGKQARMLPQEGATFNRIITTGPESYTKVLLRTIATDPKEAFQQSKEVVTLIDGSVGKLAAKMPQEANGFAQMYDQDGLAFNDQWDAILSPFRRVRQHMRVGTHLDCVSPEALDRSIERIASIREARLSGAVGAIAVQNMAMIDNPIFAANSGSQFYAEAVAAS